MQYLKEIANTIRLDKEEDVPFIRNYIVFDIGESLEVVSSKIVS